MPAWKSLHDIEAWKLARRICKQVTYITNQPCYRKDSGLRRQMLNSSGSMMDNIAEGFGRGSNVEFKTFVGYSKGSAEELYSQLIRSHDKGYMSDREFETLRYNVLLFGRHCGGIIRSIKDRKEERGYRFQEDPALYQYTISTRTRTKIKDTAASTRISCALSN